MSETLTLPVKLQSAKVRVSVDPIHLLFARQISAAFHDAKRTDPATGYPSEHAREQYRWILENPPEPVRIEMWTDESGRLCGNIPFVYCCQQNGYDVATVRKEGLPIAVYGWKETTGGIDAIHHAWALARVAWRKRNPELRIRAH